APAFSAAVVADDGLADREDHLARCDRFGDHDGGGRKKRDATGRALHRGGWRISFLLVDAQAVASDLREWRARPFLAAHFARYGTRIDLRSADERDDGRPEGQGSRAGNRHVQSDAPTRWLAGHCG